MNTKYCPKCDTEKPTETFGAAKRRDSLRAWCKDCERIYRRLWSAQLKEKIFDKLGHVCVRCGFADKRALQIDHVKGGGVQEIKSINSTSSYLRKVLTDTEGNYQILCANCNWIKRYERKEFSEFKGLSPKNLEGIRKANTRPLSAKTLQKMKDSHLGQKPSLGCLARRSKSITESWKDPEIRDRRLKALRVSAEARRKVPDDVFSESYLKNQNTETTAKELGISQSLVRLRANELGIFREILEKTQRSEQNEIICNLLKEGKNIQQIADSLGLKYTTVWYRIRSKNLKEEF